MNQKMIKHFLNLYKNGGKLMKFNLDENQIILCDGYLFFIQEKKSLVLNEDIFMELEKDIFTEFIEKDEYREGIIACYLPTYRKNKFNILIKDKENDTVFNRVIISGEKLALFDYEKLEIRKQAELVKIYGPKGKLLGGILPIRCSSEAYKI